ncbi:MAG: hypothetical protein ACYDAD_11685 [Acidimicrobiales bacterium]
MSESVAICPQCGVELDRHCGGSKPAPGCRWMRCARCRRYGYPDDPARWVEPYPAAPAQ